MVRKKNSSKRLSLKNKYKVQKKVQEHNRKERRAARRDPSKRTKLTKEPKMPNLWPMKEAFMRRQQRVDAKQERKKALLGVHNGTSAAMEGVTTTPPQKRSRSDMEQMKEMMNKVRKDQNAFVQREELVPLGSFNMKDSSKKTFFREFKKVVKASDVILQVLDARDPLGSRSPAIEQQILNLDPNKKIIFVLNKIDLIPKENTEKWLTYLRNEFPAIAFKASTQKQRDRFGRNNAKLKDITDGKLRTLNECLGADTLISLLKNYSRSFNIKKNITVGIIGFPNVGKSSIINSLKRSRAVGTGARPGFTKVSQEVVLDKNISLLDCPGIIFSTDMSESDAALRNCLSVDQLVDPLLPISAIMKRVPRESLVQVYQIPMFNDGTDFLRLVAAKRGKMKTGGIFNIAASAKIVLNDWNTGKIPYYTRPPEVTVGQQISSSVVGSWGAQFNMNSVVKVERQAVLDKVDSMRNENIVFATELNSTMASPSDMFLDLKTEDVPSEEEEDEDQMETETETKSTGAAAVGKVRQKKSERKEAEPAAKRIKLAEDPTISQTNADVKKKGAAASKKKRENEEYLNSLTKNGGGEMEVEATGDYEFGADFWA